MSIPLSRRSMIRTIGAAGALALAGCVPTPAEPSPPSVTLYTPVDEPVARPIVEAFTARTQIKVNLRTDAEATKTVGLAAKLEAEKSNPQADVWWSNEAFHSINLAAAGVLASYESPAARDIPDLFKDKQHRWMGTSLRARVICVSTRDPALAQKVRGLQDLLDPALKDKVALARPAAGTTAGHMAALYTLWGKDKFAEFLKALKGNGVKLVGGNSVVAEQVGSGNMLAGITDNDDVDAMLKNKGKLAAILPDQQDGGIGTLTIPCTAGLVAGAKKAEHAKKLIDYLISPEVEQKMIAAKFAAYSVYDKSPARVRAMNVAYPDVAGNLKPAVELALTLLERQ